MRRHLAFPLILNSLIFFRFFKKSLLFCLHLELPHFIPLCFLIYPHWLRSLKRFIITLIWTDRFSTIFDHFRNVFHSRLWIILNSWWKYWLLSPLYRWFTHLPLQWTDWLVYQVRYDSNRVWLFRLLNSTHCRILLRLFFHFAQFAQGIDKTVVEASLYLFFRDHTLGLLPFWSKLTFQRLLLVFVFCWLLCNRLLLFKWQFLL